MPAEHSIPQNISTAFRNALEATDNWLSGGPEPGIALGRQTFPVGSICDFAGKFSEALPDYLFIFLCQLAYKTRQELPSDRSYGAAAQCLRRVYGHLSVRNSTRYRARCA